ncbi:MAG: rhombosortase [Gammaproteobacteria bacterium]|nr:rhombosortase [Gammaproteobacteria bacterium]
MTYFNKIKNQYRHYWFPVVLIVFFALLQWVGKDSLRYQNDLLSSHQWWRVLSAHWVHLNWLHWLLNSAGFLLLVALLELKWSARYWLLIISLQSLSISLGFLLFNPNLIWYVGFSGVLYGLYIFAAITRFKKDRFIASAILLLVLVKVVIEQWFGDSASSAALLGAPVVVDAHAYGVLCGGLMGTFIQFKKMKNYEKNK